MGGCVLYALPNPWTWATQIRRATRCGDPGKVTGEGSKSGSGVPLGWVVGATFVVKT